jgi:pimeloyl-ACP methyl ester carboxylesterase
MSAAPPKIAVDALRHAVGNEPGVIAALARMTVPVVAINAEQGHTDTAALRRHGVEPVLMPGVGHFLMMEDPEGFNRLLIDAVEGFSA